MSTNCSTCIFSFLSDDVLLILISKLVYHAIGGLVDTIEGPRCFTEVISQLCLD